MEALIGALCNAGASLPQSSKDWRRRLRTVDHPFVLCQTLAEIEEQVSQLADGQPAGAIPGCPSDRSDPPHGMRCHHTRMLAAGLPAWFTL